MLLRVAKSMWSHKDEHNVCSLPSVFVPLQLVPWYYQICFPRYLNKNINNSFTHTQSFCKLTKHQEFLISDGTHFNNLEQQLHLATILWIANFILFGCDRWGPLHVVTHDTFQALLEQICSFFVVLFCFGKTLLYRLLFDFIVLAIKSQNIWMIVDLLQNCTIVQQVALWRTIFMVLQKSCIQVFLLKHVLQVIKKQHTWKLVNFTYITYSCLGGKLSRSTLWSFLCTNCFISCVNTKDCFFIKSTCVGNASLANPSWMGNTKFASNSSRVQYPGLTKLTMLKYSISRFYIM